MNRFVMILFVIPPMRAMRVSAGRALNHDDVVMREESDAQGKCRALQSRTLCPENYESAAGFGVEDKQCISMLCDQNEIEACCKVRQALLDHKRATPEDFKYAGQVAPPRARPFVIPPPIHVDMAQAIQRTTCPDTSRIVTFGGSHRVNFHLPESAPGNVKVNCGEGSAEPAAQVLFTCGADLKWSHASGTCSEPSVCERTTFTYTLTGPQGESVYTFKLPRTANKLGLPVDVPAQCPFDSENRGGEAWFTCQPDLQWTFKEETCSKSSSVNPGGTPSSGAVSSRHASGGCMGHAYKFTYNGWEHTYTDLDMSDGETITRGCVHGPYRFGSVRFRCSGGELSIASSTCKKYAGTVCGKTEMTMTMGPDVNVVFDLPETEAREGGASIDPLPCGQGFLGEVAFSCQQDGSWKYESGRCHAGSS